MRRSSVNKRQSARKFSRAVSRTHPKNLRMPMRGGYRL